MTKRFAIGLLLLLLAAWPLRPAGAQTATPLFAADEVIQLTLRGPFGELTRGDRAETPREAVLMLAGANAETHAITLAPRGITRRRRDICAFPPLRIAFRQPPGAGSLFRGQHRMKLVTHCRPGESFQNFTLLEYAAYRLYNVLTPLSFRARLARIDYVEEGAERPFLTRYGFLIEDGDDAARRSGLREIDAGSRIRVAQLSPTDAARYAVFEYMIGNLDWAMNAAPAGENCCHNSRLFGPANATAALIPTPYDFDYSGFVNAPYAVPPEGVPVRNVRSRRYRGFCVHNDAAQAAAAEFRAARPALLAALDVPGLEPRARASAAAYLETFFRDIAAPEAVTSNLLRNCL